MNKLAILMSVAVIVTATAVFSSPVAKTRVSEITTFDSVQQNNDYRVSLLGITKGIAFVDSQEPIGDGSRAPGKNAVPWMRVVAVIEKLTGKDETSKFRAETADGQELVGKLQVESNGRVVGSRVNGGIAEFDCDHPALREAAFPVGLPEDLKDDKCQVYAFTLSGKFQASETAVLRFAFGDKDDRRELVFKDVPLP